jgi:hypothetical protein
MTEVKQESIAKFRPQRANRNKHTQRGTGALEASMRKLGYVAPMTASADGEIIDGSARLETSAIVFDDDVLVVHHRGDKPIIMVRDDIPNADTPEARQIAIAANRVAQLNLDFDVEGLLADAASGLDLTGLFSQNELDEMLAELTPPNGDDWAGGFAGLPTQDKAPFQQMTFTLHDTQAEQVKRAIGVAAKMEDFTDSPNQNGNGNALSLICETFITEYGQR